LRGFLFAQRSVLEGEEGEGRRMIGDMNNHGAQGDESRSWRAVKCIEKLDECM